MDFLVYGMVVIQLRDAGQSIQGCKILPLNFLANTQPDLVLSETQMSARFPSAEEYLSQKALYGSLTVVDLDAHQRTINEPYRNDVLSNINNDCMRMSVFEGEYRWHFHPDSDELFLVAEGKLQIDIADSGTVELTQWQYVVVPAGTVHRTRAIGRTVNLTYEKQGAGTVFVDVEQAQ